MEQDNTQISFTEMISRAYSEFGNAVVRQDYHDCVKKLGVLEFLNVPDIENHAGLVHMLGGEYSKAIECFEQVTNSSPFFSEAMRSLATAYMYVGEYLQLDGLLKRSCFEISEIDEMDIRLKCLEHMTSEYLDAQKAQILSAEPRVVHAVSDDGSKSFYSVCQIFANGLVISGECIHQCLLYQLRNGKAIDIDQNPDIDLYVKTYEKWILILSHSRFVKGIQFTSNIDSLATCALCDKSWQEKLAIFSMPKYVQQIVQIIFNLGRPELHPRIDSYTAVEHVLEKIIHICPSAIGQVVDHYFSVVAEAYQKEIGTAAQYLGYAYAEILAQDADPYQLKERIEQIRMQTDAICVNDTVAEIKLARGMSRKGHDALVNALSSHKRTSEKVVGANDYSALALQFFRVLEIEYSEKLLKPLAASIDIGQFKAYAEGCLNENNKKGWLQDVVYLSKIVNGEQESFEIGKLRTLLAKLTGYRTQNDDCAVYLRKIIDGMNILSQDGRNALYSNKRMLDVVGKNPVEKYRIPGAHTGYLPYSVACEAKDYVTKNLPEIVSWFN